MSAEAKTAVVRLLISEVERRVRLNRTTLWRKYTASPPTFPTPHFIGTRRCWFETDIAEWERKEMARPAPTRRAARNLLNMKAAPADVSAVAQ